MKYTKIKVNRVGGTQNKLAWIFGETHGHKVALLKEDITNYGLEQTSCLTFLIDAGNGVYHFMQSKASWDANHEMLTSDKVKEVCENLKKKENN